MSKSRYLISSIIGFCLGVLLSEYVIPKESTVAWLVALVLVVTFMLWSSKYVRLLGISLMAIFLGTLYPHALGREQLFILSGDLAIIEWLAHARLAFTLAIARVVPEPAASLATGLVVGTGGNFPRELKDAFINTGTIHIVAVSGFNVTIVLRIFSEWLRPLGRWPAFIVGTLAIIAFLIIVGGQASVVRAGVMGWLFLLARFVFRPFHIRNALFIAGFFMVLFEPKILKDDIGFQLSFLAMMGLIYISPLLKMLFEKIVVFRYIPNFITAALVETLAAQIAVSFLIMAYFGRLSIIAPITNILIVPIIIFPMLFTLFIGLLSLLNIGLTAYLAIPLTLSLRYILKVIDIFNIPSASVELKNPSWITVVGLYCLLILICRVSYVRYRRRFVSNRL